MQEFVKAAQNGDMSAWNVLYRKHQPWLYSAALSICGNSPAAKDAVQDTFMQAYLKLNQLKDPAVFPAWLKTMLFRNCYRNKQQNFLTLSNHLLFEGNNSWEDEISRKLELFGQQIKLYDTLTWLPEILRSVLLLRYFSCWHSYEQIAKILCVPVGTVRSRLNQAKQKMMEYWKEGSTDNERAFREAEEWNHFYKNYLGTAHSSLNSREKLIPHFDKNLQLVFTSGKTAYGRELIEKEIEEDLVYGNSFGNLQVMSSGSISIVEVCNINSTEYPNRCPDSGIFVLYRNKSKVNRLNFHNSK